MLVDNSLLYCRIANRPSPAYSFLYLSNFLSYRTFDIFFVFIKSFCSTLLAREIIFGMLVGDDVLYCGTTNQPSSIILPCIYLGFFLSILCHLLLILGLIRDLFVPFVDSLMG